MQADLDRLIALQQVDLHLHDLNRQISDFPMQRAAVARRLEDARRVVTDAQAAKKENELARHKLEVDMKQIEEKAEKLRGQLNEVKTNEAYRALQDEIAYLEKQKSAAEDKVLEAMVGSETYDAKIAEAQVVAREAEQTVHAELSKLDSEQSAREEQAAELRATQEKLRGEISDDSLSDYDRLRRAKHNLALAEARDETCLACQTRIRPQVFMEVRRREQLHTCESCHRILYFLAEPPTVDVEKETTLGEGNRGGGDPA